MAKVNQLVTAVYVDNRYGVLTRVTSMFTRRGFNIDALTVGETEHPEYSRITISMSGDGYAREQMINQLRKLYNVKKVEVLEDDSIRRELCVEITGDPTKIDAFVKLMVPFGIIEMCRTGIVALERGGQTLLGK